jgi:spore coat protein U-like protein
MVHWQQREIMMRTTGMAVTLAVLAGLFPCASLAGTSGTLTVSATVKNSCAVSSDGALGFGEYDASGPNATAPLVAQSSRVQLRCTSGTAATILLSQGTNPGSGSSDAAPQRALANGSARLNYQLYTSAAHGSVWDNVRGVSQTGTGTSQAINIYGVIAPGQKVPAGSYSDLVVITVNY